MSNKPFHFKQFTIHQDLCAMKVGTDGVLLGAWADTSKANSILDVGTGTGLISLMIAQRTTNASIVAIEVDEQATQQAQHNFELSRWREQLQLISSSFQNFVSTQQFDLIVSNPPFYKADSAGTPREIARNQKSLPLSFLIKKSSSLLSLKGTMAFVLPFNQMDELLTIINENNLFLNRLTTVKGNQKSAIKRILVEIGKTNQHCEKDELFIELEKRHQYSREYKKLLFDYLTIF